MNRTRFTFVFFIKKRKLLKNGEAPICLRITVNGLSVESLIKRSTPPDSWDQDTQSVKGRDRRAQETNECIHMLKIRTLQIHRDLELCGAHFTARLIMNKLYSAEEKRTLLTIFRKHNNDIRQLIGIELEKRTVSRYDSCCNYMEDMIKRVYWKDDVSLAEVNGELVRNYEMHLKVVRGCQANTVIRYMKCFKKVIYMALANEWMTKDPFIGIHFSAKPANKDVLTKDELDIMIEREFRVRRLECVRDVFIFCCFTGIAYIDAHTLRAQHIVNDNKGEPWIKKIREKTDIEFHVPLLKIPQQILEKYKDDPGCERTGLLLPILSNQKMNDYLKEIAALCEIKKTPLDTYCEQNLCNDRLS